MARPLTENGPSIMVRDSTGMVWQVSTADIRPSERDDGKVEAPTPKGEVLVLPPVEEWSRATIYDGAPKAS